MPEIVLIRGVPGSGKTTKAKAEYPEHELIEADQFFMRGGKYCYDRSKIKEAHDWCQNTAKWWLKRGHDVVVANTFTRVWEMQPYFNIGYPVRVIEATGNYDNVHGVPPEIVEQMRARYEAYCC